MATVLLRTSSILWVIWGLVHVLAGVMTILQPTPGDIAAIADAIDPKSVDGEYAPAVGALINQHGFNLLWIGAFATVGGVFVWRRSPTAIAMTAVVAGLTDLGYFLFMDLGGFVNFVPGTIMTLICAAAIAASVTAYSMKSAPGAAAEA